MAGMAAVMRSRRRAATAGQVRDAWRKVGVSLPRVILPRAVWSLTSREVVAGERAYSFAVDLQRLWLEKHRRLDWVKEELAEAVREWDRSARGWSCREDRGRRGQGRWHRRRPVAGTRRGVNRRDLGTRWQGHAAPAFWCEGC